MTEREVAFGSGRGFRYHIGSSTMPPPLPEEACMVNRPDSDVEIERLQLRFAGARVSDDRAVRRLMQSIDACGQLVACIAVDDDSAQAVATTPLVLIDGYRRVAVLRRLGRDTARVQCCSGTIGQALAQRRSSWRAHNPGRWPRSSRPCCCAS